MAIEAVDETDVDAVDATSIIDDDLWRSLAPKLNPFVKLGESPPVNLAPSS